MSLKPPDKPLCLGLLYPADGTDTEILHLDRWLPRHGVPGITVKVEFPGTAVHERAALMALGSAGVLSPFARKLGEAGCHAVVWACTSASFIGGLAWAREQARMLTAASGRPATSATLAMIEAVRAIGATVVDVLGAYPAPITESFIGCLADSGIRVADTASLGAPDALASFRLDIAGDIKRFAERGRGRSYPLLLPDTAIDSLPLLDRLEEIAGRPVIAASQACVWHGLELLGVAPVAERAGSLFRRAVAATLPEAAAHLAPFHGRPLSSPRR